MKLLCLCSLFLPLLLNWCATVAAHGFVWRVTIAGKLYMGNIPNGSPNASIVRQIDTVEPVKGAMNPYVNCGQDAQLASLEGTANPGDVLTFDWRGGDLSLWPHNTGPLMWYMTPCGSTPCSQYNSSSAKWFKINQIGTFPNGTWVQAAVQSGTPANVTLPDNIAPGEYILRHEIIALHLATSLGGAEFYPSCTQLTITGSGTAVPSENELVTLPGAYSDYDPGIYDPDVFNSGAPYTFPGPPIAQLALATAAQPTSNYNATYSASGSSSGSSPGSSPGSSSGSTTPGSGSSTSGASGASTEYTVDFCILKPKPTAQSYLARRLELFPQELKRTLQDLYNSISR